MRLELKHFGKHASLVVDGGSSALLAVGRNRCGKTTLRDAVEFALLGTCALRGFALKKDVGRYMVNEVAESATVTLSLGGWAVRRSVKSNGAQKIALDRHGNGGWVEVSADEFAKFLPAVASPDAVRCALESDHFWRMAPGERAALLVEIAGGAKPTAAAIDAAFADVLRDTGPHRARISDFAVIAADQGFEAANAAAVELRRAKKRERAEVEVGPPVEVALVDGQDPRLDPLDALRRGLADARTELATAEAGAQRGIGWAQGRLEEAEAALVAADSEWLEVSTTLWRDFPKTPWAEGEKVEPTAILDAEEIVKGAFVHRSAIERETKALTEIDARLAEIAAEVATVGRTQAAAAERELPKACPAVEFAFECPVEHSEFREARARAREAAERAAKANAAKLVKRRAELGEETLRLKRLVDLRTLQRDQAREALRGAEAAPSAEVVASFRAQVERRERVVAERERYDAAAKAQAERQRRADQLDAEIAWLDAAEKQLRPDGIESRLASGGAARLRAVLAGAEPYFGVIDLDGSFEVSIDGRHVASASKSEQRCAGIAVQRAIAEAVDLPLVVVDELDALDAGWRRRFVGYGREFAGAGLSLLALATASSSEAPGRPPEGFATAWIRPGRVEMIERGEGEA